jgi:hypothetical protein
MGRGVVRRGTNWVLRSTLHSVVAATTAVAVVGGTIAGVAVARHHGTPPNGGARNTGAAGNQGGGGTTQNPPNLATSAARLEGTWQITAGSMSGTWTFTPSCSTGPCGGSSVRTANDFGAQGQSIDVTGSFTFSGGTFRGTERYTATCGNDASTPFPVPVADVFQFAVSKAARVDGQLTATRIAGFTNHSAQIIQSGSSACGYNAGTVPLTGRRVS